MNTHPLMWDERDTAFGHIYPQFVWHSDAKFIGNEAALRALAAGALAAADGGRATVEMFASDGEGYALSIERTNVTGLGYTRLPYYADYARNNEEDYAASLRSRIAALEGALTAAGVEVPEDV